MKIYNIIYNIIIIIIFITLSLFTWKYYKVNKEYKTYKQRIEMQSDSLMHVNDSIKYKLDSILIFCDDLQSKVDSLNRVKQQIIIEKESYKINDNMLDCVENLKQNLKCVIL